MAKGEKPEVLEWPKLSPDLTGIDTSWQELWIIRKPANNKMSESKERVRISEKATEKDTKII